MSNSNAKGETTLIAIDALDQLSRCRTLTGVESFNLERLIRMQESSATGMARLAEWRLNGLVMALHIPEIDKLMDKRTRSYVLEVLRKVGVMEEAA